MIGLHTSVNLVKTLFYYNKRTGEHRWIICDVVSLILKH